MRQSSAPGNAGQQPSDGTVIRLAPCTSGRAPGTVGV